MNSICKARRGQVWFIVNPNAPIEYQGSVQGKNRPWLIVSNDKCNEHSPTFSAVPVTTAAKKPLPVHVHFNDGKLDQIILCEQQQTFPISLLTAQGSYYKYALSSELMDQVGEALAIQNGIKLQIPNADRFWQSIEQLIKSRVKEALACAKVDAIDVGKLSTLIDVKVSEMINTEVEAEVKAEPEIAPVKEPEPEPVQEPVTKKKQTRRKYTIAEKQEFLSFYARNGAKATSEKYDMKIGTVHTTRFRFYKEVEATKKDANV